MESGPNDIESRELPRYRQAGGVFLLLLFGLGLVFATKPGAERSRCGGSEATISSNEARILGTRGPDVIAAGPGPNAIHGGRGNDTICGGGGGDRIHGGRGNDRIEAERGNDTIHGGRGSDEVSGGVDRDRVRGDSGNDTVRGGPGDRDDVDGGRGDDEVAGGRGVLDTVHGGIGNDRIDGGPGRHDIASYRSAGGPVEVDLSRRAVVGAEEEPLIRVEDVVGGNGEDVLVGSAGTPNRLDGGPGDDLLRGAMGSDQAFGGPGSDECLGSFAVEDSCGPAGGHGGGTRVELYESITASSSLTIVGNDRVDEVTVTRGDRGYVVRGGSGNPVLLSAPQSGGCDLVAGSASCASSVTSILVSLSGGDDTFTVEDSVPAEIAVTVDGGPGGDWLRGGRGADTIYAGDDGDPDTLAGRGGDDALFGVNILHPRRGSGAARLFGGAGDDLLIGGQPCAGDLLHGGGGETDSASFARVRNAGAFVEATIGGRVTDPDAGCAGGRIDGSVEKIEGSPGPDVLIGGAGPETLLGRGGADLLDARGGPDRCIGGRGGDRQRHCEYVR
jgi:Ca2+-binding RTX toxin-like protein